jgi:KDO2-lipid IV(A) lauroyltransferase
MHMLAWLLKTMAKGVALLPLGWAMTMARHWGGGLAHVVRLRRTYVLDALKRGFPGKTEAERRALYAEMWRHQALTVLELLRYAGGRTAELGERLEAHGLEKVKEAHARGKGVLVLSAHFGNYPLLALQVPRLFGYPLSVIVKPLKSATLDGIWWELQRKAGVSWIPSHNAYRASVRALRNNELVGFMLDQNRPTDQGVFVDFFGRPASTSPGLAFMAAQTGAPVVPVFMRRTPEGRHVLEVGAIIEPPPDRQAETILAYTAACTKIIEDEVRRHPEQWLWLHKRWKSRPPTETAAPSAAAP